MLLLIKIFIFLNQIGFEAFYTLLFIIKYYFLILFYIYIFELIIVNIVNFNVYLRNYIYNKKKNEKKILLLKLKNLDVVIKSREEEIIKGKLIKIEELKFKSLNQYYIYITLLLFNKDQLNINYRIEIDNIKECKKNNKYKYNLMVNILKNYSNSFKKIDKLVEKHIKDFLYINNND